MDQEIQGIKSELEQLQQTESELSQPEPAATPPVILPDQPTHMPAATIKEAKPLRRLRVFLCHLSADKPAARDLYHRLRADGIDPWFDEENLLPGQNRELEIKKAIHSADIVVVCLSRESLFVAVLLSEQIEEALNVAAEQPEGTIFLIPFKLEGFKVPPASVSVSRLRHLHWINLFEEGGYEKLMRALQARAEATIGITMKPPPM